MPVDLVAVQADDALLDLIGRAGHTPSDTDDELTRVVMFQCSARSPRLRQCW
jgi:hypothetical protein